MADTRPRASTPDSPDATTRAGRLTAGIDLGTTTSVVATVDGATPRVIRDPAGYVETPSVVGRRPRGRPEADPEVGRSALAALWAGSDNAVASVKRILGASTDAQIAGRAYSPEQLAGLIFQKLMADAARDLGEPATSVVVAVPVWFGQTERAAVRAAATSAGVPLAGLIDEPVAAALSYAARTSRADRPEHLLVYDFGGGKFEASIVARAGDSLTVLASTGDQQLGGDDLDRVVLGHVRARVAEEYGPDVVLDEASLPRLRHAVRDAREQLSRVPVVGLVQPGGCRTAEGGLLDLDTDLRRDEVEPLIRPFVERTIALTKDAVTSAGLAPDGVDGLLMISFPTLSGGWSEFASH
jgi:molecular chaperone DnaK